MLQQVEVSQDPSLYSFVIPNFKVKFRLLRLLNLSELLDWSH